MKTLLRHQVMMLSVFIVLMFAMACEKKYFPVEPPPKTAVQTNTLEASYVSTPPLTIADAYWKKADYLKVKVSNMSTGNLYSEGYLNMSGTYSGLSSFSGGKDPNLTMKAAYDDNKLYIYVEWTDDSLDAPFKAALLKGFPDPLKNDSTGAWTSQGNSDKMALAFEINNASSAFGSFTDQGCAASCHQNKMQPQSGSVDIWSWDVASSEALGYAHDMVADGNNGYQKDAGAVMVTPNKVSPGSARSAPAYEWSGAEQSYTRPDGKVVTLDPGYYLLASKTTSFVGDYLVGEKIYNDAATGTNCDHCHGINGRNGEATEFASIGFARKYSRQQIIDFAASEAHDGWTYFVKIPASKHNDLLAFIRGLGSVPGQLLSPPNGSYADVWSISNINRTKVNKTPHTVYSVILVRTLTTPNADDVQFTSPEGKSVPFGIALMDADGKNHIGSRKEILTFKPKSK
ncbi:MAG TPA: ethylbenzene dehydrogenase-related protein [Bacteroidia bacterium]|nr:ethylbenzene dehydrogenase-related protein [Bacteroidia bacterium]